MALQPPGPHETSNPTFADRRADAAAGGAADAAADIEAALLDGTASVEQLFVLMESKMDSRTAELEARLTLERTPTESSMRSVVALQRRPQQTCTRRPSSSQGATTRRMKTAGKRFPAFLLGWRLWVCSVLWLRACLSVLS